MTWRQKSESELKRDRSATSSSQRVGNWLRRIKKLSKLKNRATCEVQRLDILGYSLANTVITE